jgi:hypothetical protein
LRRELVKLKLIDNGLLFHDIGINLTPLREISDKFYKEIRTLDYAVAHCKKLIETGKEEMADRVYYSIPIAAQKEAMTLGSKRDDVRKLWFFKKSSDLSNIKWKVAIVKN